MGKARYSEAISAFQKASDANPRSPVPHIYLAIGWFQQYIPGAASADNADRGRQAETELRRALDLDPKSWMAAVMLGQLAFSERRLEEAREWYRKASAVEPRNADTWCVLGAIAWWQWLRQGQPAHQPVLEEAISDFEKSVGLDPVHEVAMQYLSLLLRERAGTRDRDEEKRKDL
ncbi:MAG TPA: tetratricopeptide repeat protein, partial [Candidatus Solibacter sp.]|nr:tetratricopeptide repeat protein [Candidatus Solibacter sp.]